MISKAKKRTNRKWDQKNMKCVTCNLRKEDAEAFQIYCEDHGRAPNYMLKKYIFSCIGKDLETDFLDIKSFDDK